MIRRMATPYGNILYYTAAPVAPAEVGDTVFASVFDQPLYAQLTEVITQQKVATVKNAQVLDNYNSKLADYQGVLSSGRAATTRPPITAPVKPQYIVVADAPAVSDDPEINGTPVITLIDWPGGLPDAVQPRIFASSGPRTAAAYDATVQKTA